MGLIAQTIANLKGGVSQQPDTLRFPEQGSAQINGWSSETSGLQKRPPLIFTKRLGAKGYLGTKPYIHFINRDEREQYYVCLTGSGIKIFNLQGTEMTVSTQGSSASYVSTSNPRDDLRLLTIADYTFIVNNKRKVRASSKVNLPNYEVTKDAIVNVRGGQYGRTLEIIINSTTVAKYTIPNGDKPEHVKNTDAQWLATELARQINASFSTRWRAVVGQGYIYLVNNGEAIRTLETRDGYNDQLINPITHYVQNFNKLPLNAPDDYIVKIVGDTSSSKDEYYVQYDATTRTWKECLGWKTEVGIDNNTMPHVLISEGGGRFTLKAFEWSERTCGDLDTNPDPSFIDATINDIFLYRNRLGLLSGENVILSRTGKYGNFFPSSIAVLSEDDPIDLAVSSNRINILKFAVPFNNELLLWSDEAQFSLFSEGNFSATNLTLNLVTSYDISDKARPYMIGKGVYFANPRSGHTSIYRYYSVRDAIDLKSAEDMSVYVPNYIPNGVFSIRGATTENYCTVLTSGAPSKIFVYKFFYIDEKLVQQSWSHWEFGKGTNILANDAIGSMMYPIIETDGHIYLCSLMFTQDTKDFDDEPYRLYMDAKVRYTVPSTGYDIDENMTTIDLKKVYGTSSLPFKYGKIIISNVRGKIYEFEEPERGHWTESDTIKIQGDITRTVLFIGLSYSFDYEFSKFLIRQSDNQGKIKAVDTGRLQLRRAWVNYGNSGFFKVKVYNGSTEYVYRMTGSVIGSKSSALGVLSISDGQFKFPCMGKAENVTVRLTSDTPTPLSLIGCGWEGAYVRRTSSI